MLLRSTNATGQKYKNNIWLYEKHIALKIWRQISYNCIIWRQITWTWEWTKWRQNCLLQDSVRSEWCVVWNLQRDQVRRICQFIRISSEFISNDTNKENNRTLRRTMPRHNAVQAAQTLNVDTAVPQYRHSYIIGSGIVNHHRIIRFECKPNRWNCWKRKGKKQRTKSVKVGCICTEKQRLIH